MSYSTVARIQQDPDIRVRVAACVATIPLGARPEDWAAEHSWAIAAQPDWAEAWEAALSEPAHAEDQSYRPGDDQSVISDGMILAAVQALSSGAS